MPPAARQIVAGTVNVARYPSLYADHLKRALSRYVGLPASMITTGCGSDDVLDSAIRALSEAGDCLAYSPPTFPMVPIFARMNGLTPLTADLDDLGATGARIIYVCSPNNPCGGTTSRKRVEALIERSSTDQIIIIDEAYAEFASGNLLALTTMYPNVVITRTMSKAFGLAGLRIGYALGHESVIAEVEKSRGPYKVSAVAERAAIAALTDGLPWVEEHVALVKENRALLTQSLVDRGLAPKDSSANFVFFPVAAAEAVAREMRRLGVAVRAFTDPSGLRITVGTRGQIEEALTAFDVARQSCE
jgi:histidinol-phosphate aminotransferase